jgi:hypothetical protein
MEKKTPRKTAFFRYLHVLDIQRDIIFFIQPVMPPVLVGWGAGWAPEPLWTTRR